jgi:hypothetical protein
MTLSGLQALGNTLVALAGLAMLGFAIVAAVKGKIGTAVGIFICSLLAVGSYAVVTDFAGVGTLVLNLFR